MYVLVCMFRLSTGLDCPHGLAWHGMDGVPVCPCPSPPPLLPRPQDLAHFARYTGLRAVAHLRYGDTLGPNSMVCSTAFDRDDEFFALAGVGKRIKIYDAAGVAANAIGLHYPTLDILSR